MNPGEFGAKMSIFGGKRISALKRSKAVAVPRYSSLVPRYRSKNQWQYRGTAHGYRGTVPLKAQYDSSKAHSESN